jgi:tetratricopeptide (TPR) repeat protein
MVAWGFLPGRDAFPRAREAANRALELDPLSLIVLAHLGWFLPVDKQLEYYKKILEMDSEFQPAQNYLANAYFVKGKYDKAFDIYEKLDRQPQIGDIYIKTKKISEARQILNKLLENPTQFPDSCGIARLCFLLGKKNEGFEWLEKACEDKNRLYWG